MGARAQAYIKDNGVYLYTHWGAGTIFHDVHKALNSPEGKARREDPEYLTRIIFDHIKQHATDPELGYGIGTNVHGDIERLVTIDCAEKMVTFEDYNEGTKVSRSFLALTELIPETKND